MPAPKGHPPYNVGVECGRPPKYNNEQIDKFAEELLIWIQNPFNIFFAEFCLNKQINTDYMQEWQKTNENFRGAYKLAKQTQELRLNKGSVYKDFDSGFVKFLLVNNHAYNSYSDKTEQKLSADVSVKTYLSEIKDTSDIVNE